MGLTVQGSGPDSSGSGHGPAAADYNEHGNEPLGTTKRREFY